MDHEKELRELLEFMLDPNEPTWKSECPEAVRWALDEIVRLRKLVDEYESDIEYRQDNE